MKFFSDRGKQSFAERIGFRGLLAKIGTAGVLVFLNIYIYISFLKVPEWEVVGSLSEHTVCERAGLSYGLSS